jgi:hypothetical protein
MICLGCAATGQGGWTVLREDAYHNRFAYDAASIKRTVAGTVTVWAESTGAKYLYEIDCEAKKLRLLEGTGAAPDQWFDLVGNSGDQLLFDEVCRPMTR